MSGSVCGLYTKVSAPWVDYEQSISLETNGSQWIPYGRAGANPACLVLLNFGIFALGYTFVKEAWDWIAQQS